MFMKINNSSNLNDYIRFKCINKIYLKMYGVFNIYNNSIQIIFKWYYVLIINMRISYIIYKAYI